MTAAKGISQEYENWLRLMTLVDFAGRSLCRDVLFKLEKLPEDEVELFKVLEPLKSRICRYQDQQEVLCPSARKTDHSKFDLTLFTSIITVKYGNKYKSLVDDLRNARNEEFHKGDKLLSGSDFNQLWNDTSQMLVNHGFDPKLVKEVKDSDLSSHQKFRDILYSIIPGQLKEMKEVLKKGVQSMKEEVVKDFKKDVKEGVQSMKEEVVKDVKKDVKEGVQSMKEEVVKDIKKDLKEGLQSMKEEVVKDIKKDVKEGVQSMKEEVVKDIKKNVKEGVQSMKEEVVKDIKKDVKEGVQSMKEEVVKDIKKNVKEGVQSMKEEVVKDIKKDIREGVKEVVEVMKETTENKELKMKENCTREPMEDIERCDFTYAGAPALGSKSTQSFSSGDAKQQRKSRRKQRAFAIPRPLLFISRVKKETAESESRGEQRKELKLKVGHSSKQRPFISGLRQFFSKRKGKAASAETLCHNENIDGFYVISHNPSIEDIKKILDKKNTKNIEVYSGPHHRSHVGEPKFEKQCTAYFKRYFENLAGEDPIILPWCMANDFYTRSMAHWCQGTNISSTIKGLVLHNFSILQHTCRHGFTKEMLQDFLQIENLSQAPSIVVYNPNVKLILLLRKAVSKKLAADIALGINDLQLFILLFHDVLTNSGMKLTYLVVTDEKVNPDNLDCDLCKNHVLSEKDFPDFDNWLEEKESYFKAGSGKMVKEAFSKDFSAKLTGVLAAACILPNYIPIFTDEQDDHEHMEHLTVLLTPAQMDVYYSEKKHMIIKGGFGCGKSIVAAAMLRKIASSLGEDEQLSYICYDPRSELLSKMVKNYQKKNRVTPFANKDGRKLSAIIEDISKSARSGKINFVVDEYDGEDLDESEANKLNYIISETLKEAYVVLIAQPIEKERVINGIPQEKNRFDILEITMKTHHLTLNMRNSIEIHELVEATKEVLKEEMTFFVHPEDSETSYESEASEESKKSMWKNSINEFVLTQDDHQQVELSPKLEIEEQSVQTSSDANMELTETSDESKASEESKENISESSFFNEFLSTQDDHQEVELSPKLEMEEQSLETSSNPKMELTETSDERKASEESKESISENSIFNEFLSTQDDHQEVELKPKLEIEGQSIETSSDAKMGLDETNDKSEASEESKESISDNSILNEFLSTQDDHEEVELKPKLEIEGQSVETSSDAKMELDEINDKSEPSKESISENSILNEFQEIELNPKLEIEGQSVETSSEAKMGVDEAQAVLGSPMVEPTGGKRTVSNFVYAEVDKTGHQINTERPVLYELGDKEDFGKNLAVVAIFERLLEFRKKHVVLHFDTGSNAIPSAFRFAFDHHFKTYKIITSYKEFESSGKSILVCSYPAFRGLEYPRITVLIDRDIYFLQHYLVETLARCTSELCIVIVQNSSTLTKVITEWKIRKLVIPWKTKIFKKDTLRKDYKIDIDAEHNTVNTTFKCEYYKKLEEAFKLSANNDETIASITESTAKKIIGQSWSVGQEPKRPSVKRSRR